MKTKTQKLFSILLVTLSLATGLAGVNIANANAEDVVDVTRQL